MVRAPTTTTPSARDTSPRYDVRVLGPFSVSCDGIGLDVGTWPRRGRSLLRLLATAPQHQCLRDDVVDTLWPVATPEAGASNLRTLLHRVRRGMESHLPAPIVSASGWIMLNPDCRWEIDLERFEELVQGGGDDLQMLSEAAELLDSEPLQEDRYEDWAVPIRERLQHEWRQVCFRLTSLYRVWGAREEAISCLERMLERDPFDEEALQRLLGVLGEAGQGLEALRRYRQFEQRLRDELDLEPGIDTRTIAQQVSGGEIEPIAGATLAAARRRSLPQQPTPFIGREREVAEVAGLLGRQDVRLLTLTGPGGSGKTRLTLRVAEEIQGSFADGAAFVPLASIADPALVPSAIASALGLSQRDGRSMVETLIAHLEDKALLLLLDNLEHLLPATPVLTELLASCPRLTLLVTSRSVLHLSWEHIYAVSPLAVPKLGHLPPFDELVQVEAVALFVQRAQAAKRDFAIEPRNAAAVAEICSRLDGLPLAIELAAARIRLLPPSALLARLTSRLAFLTGGAGDVPARQQTLRGTIAWSYALLNGREQGLFARMAVFMGGCTLEAAEAVCSIDSAPPLEVLEGLASLVDKSLLRLEEGPARGLMATAGRFVMLETIREYALERLSASGEAEAVHRQHALFFLQMAEEAEPELQGPRQGGWLERLEAELDNLRGAMRWFLEEGAGEEELRLAASLHRFWYIRGYWNEGQHWLEEGLARPVGVVPGVQAKALLALGASASDLGDYERATSLLGAALKMCRELGDRKGSAEALNNLGSIAALQGQYESATALFEESAHLWTELGDLGKAAGAQGNLGLVAADQGDLLAARDRFEKALEMFRSTGDAEAIANTLGNLGWVAQIEGNLARAEALYGKRLGLARGLGAKQLIAYALNNLSEVARLQGRQEQAQEQLLESLLLVRELGEHNLALRLLGNAAALAMAGGEAERAVRLKAAEAALRKSMSLPLPPVDRVEEEETLARARTLLGEEGFSRAWEEGRSMTLQQATQYASHVD